MRAAVEARRSSGAPAGPAPAGSHASASLRFTRTVAVSIVAFVHPRPQGPTICLSIRFYCGGYLLRSCMQEANIMYEPAQVSGRSAASTVKGSG
jgi:hypothetical protein